MIQAFSPFLALRYLVTRRINVLGTLGVAFAVWAMLVVDSVFTGFVSDIRADVRNSAPDLLVTDLPHDTSYELLRAVLEGDGDVAASAPRLRHYGLFQPARDRGMRRRLTTSEIDFHPTDSGFALLLGIDPVREAKVLDVRSWLTAGVEKLASHRIPADASPVLDEPDLKRRAQILLPDEIEWEARRRARLPFPPRLEDFDSVWPGLLLGWRRVASMVAEHGDPIDLLCVGIRADGSLRADSRRLAFAGWFASGNRMFDETTALLPIETLRTLLGHDKIDPLAVDLVTDVALRLERPLAPAELLACKRRLQTAVQALLPAGSAPCSVVDWEEQHSVFLGAVGREQAMMQFVLFVVIVLAAFVIYATLHMMVVQKVKDIGILAALGATPRGIGAVFLIGGLVVAAVGACLGVVAGMLSSRYLNAVNDWLDAHYGIELFPRALFDLAAIPTHLEPSWIVQVAVGSVLLAVLVAFVPSRKAARMNPVKALSYE